MSFLAIRKELEPSLLATKGIVGVGGTKGKIKVYVEGSPSIPASIGGYETEVIRCGHISALGILSAPFFRPTRALSLERTQKWTPPIPAGVSVGHPKITAGTLGLAVRIGGKVFGLSNNHVLAAASTKQNPNASVGDPILHPGTYDGGSQPEDIIGTLTKFVPLDEVGPNVVDCAIFSPNAVDTLAPEVLGIGIIQGFVGPTEGLEVRKSGRTTGVTNGTIMDINATIKVDYGQYLITFTDQIITDYMADGGDSGSLLCASAELKGVGLLFAGSSYVTVFNKLGTVINSLGNGAEPAQVSFSGLLPGIVGAAALGWAIFK